MPLRVLHTVHDYLPAHQAGSELYVAALSRSLERAGHHAVVFAAVFSPGEDHGALRWRSHAGTPVIEVVNNWEGASFDSTYDAARVSEAFAHVLDAVRPDVVHVHNLLNLSLSLPAMARARGVAVVATLHDYTLACPSGGQRVHRAEAHLCRTIDPERCARCFPSSPFYAQWQFGQLAQKVPTGLAGRAVYALARRVPRVAAAGRSALAASTGPTASAADIVTRLDAARRAFAQFQIAVAPSQSLADEYRRLGFPSGRVETSDYGFAALDHVARRPSADGRLRIGFAGTLVWHKGADILIEAVRDLPPDRIDVRIFGDEGVFPDYARELRRRAARLPISFHGRYDHQDTATILSQVDVLVVPSRWLENSPLVIHEAFMARVAVVAAAIGGMPDLLGHGQHGLLFTPDTPASLTAALQTLIDQPERVRDLALRSPTVKSIDEDGAEWIARYGTAIREAAGPMTAS